MTAKYSKFLTFTVSVAGIIAVFMVLYSFYYNVFPPKTPVEKSLAQSIALSIPKDLQSIECYSVKTDGTRLCTAVPKEELQLPSTKMTFKEKEYSTDTPHILEKFKIVHKPNGSYEVTTNFNGKYLNSDDGRWSMETNFSILCTRVSRRQSRGREPRKLSP